MQPVIQYYLAPNSPWVYLGHARLVSIAARYGARIEVKPCDLSRVFSQSGGLPLAQRAEQRRAYRLVELARFRDYLGLPLNVEPLHFPVSADLAARVIVAVAKTKSEEATLRCVESICRAVWVFQKDIADATAMATLLDEIGLNGEALLSRAGEPDVASEYLRLTDEAITRGVFGAPTYFCNGVAFWGQDRLEFLERELVGLSHGR